MYTVKHNSDSSINHYKACVVAKGLTQQYGIDLLDYSQTFVLVDKMNTVHLLIALAENYGWPLQQFDVKNAFLHGDLEEKIYVFAPLI